MLKSVILLLFVTNLCLTIDSLSSDVEKLMCQNRFPLNGKNITSMKTPSPYRLQSNVTVMQPNQVIRINITGNAKSFKGFIIQARTESAPYRIVGKFDGQISEFTKYAYCDYPNNTATNSSGKLIDKIILEWIAPTDFVGNIVFNASVAFNDEQFWVGILSNRIEVKNASNLSTSTQTPQTTKSPVQVSTTSKPTKSIYDNCGDKKICFGIPDGCTKSRKCESFAAIKFKGSKYEFELRSNHKSKYVAIGISDDNKMGNDSVMECVLQNGTIKFYNSWTIPRPNLNVTRDVPQNLAEIVASSYRNRTISCRFERNTTTNVKGTQINLLNKKYFLLLAAGSNANENGITKHDLGRVATRSLVNLTDPHSYSGSRNLLVNLYSFILIAAWIMKFSIENII